jgi:hypothetical protein
VRVNVTLLRVKITLVRVEVTLCLCRKHSRACWNDTRAFVLKNDRKSVIFTRVPVEFFWHAYVLFFIFDFLGPKFRFSALKAYFRFFDPQKYIFFFLWHVKFIYISDLFIDQTVVYSCIETTIIGFCILFAVTILSIERDKRYLLLKKNSFLGNHTHAYTAFKIPSVCLPLPCSNAFFECTTYSKLETK